MKIKDYTLEQRNERNSLMIQIMMYAYLYHDSDANEHCVFIRFSGHVDNMEIEVAESKERYNNKLCGSDIYPIYQDYSKKEPDNPNIHLKAQRDVLKRLLDENEIPYDEMECEISEVRDYYF